VRPIFSEQITKNLPGTDDGMGARYYLGNESSLPGGRIMAETKKPKCDVDPVCNIDLTEMHGKFMYDFEDEVYYFCSELCKEQFAAEPKKYAKKKKS
jgi:YHS domain-containing protein